MKKIYIILLNTLIMLSPLYSMNLSKSMIFPKTEQTALDKPSQKIIKQNYQQQRMTINTKQKKAESISPQEWNDYIQSLKQYKDIIPYNDPRKKAYIDLQIATAEVKSKPNKPSLLLLNEYKNKLEAYMTNLPEQQQGQFYETLNMVDQRIALLTEIDNQLAVNYQDFTTSQLLDHIDELRKLRSELNNDRSKQYENITQKIQRLLEYYKEKTKIPEQSNLDKKFYDIIIKLKNYNTNTLSSALLFPKTKKQIVDNITFLAKNLEQITEDNKTLLKSLDTSIFFKRDKLQERYNALVQAISNENEKQQFIEAWNIILKYLFQQEVAEEIIQKQEQNELLKQLIREELERQKQIRQEEEPQHQPSPLSTSTTTSQGTITAEQPQTTTQQQRATIITQTQPQLKESESPKLEQSLNLNEQFSKIVNELSQTPFVDLVTLGRDNTKIAQDIILLAEYLKEVDENTKEELNDLKNKIFFETDYDSEAVYESLSLSLNEKEKKEFTEAWNTIIKYLFPQQVAEGLLQPTVTTSTTTTQPTSITTSSLPQPTISSVTAQTPTTQPTATEQQPISTEEQITQIQEGRQQPEETPGFFASIGKAITGFFSTIADTVTGILDYLRSWLPF